MPLYDIQCNRSGKVFERHIKLAHFEEPIICACASPAKRLISTPLFTVDCTGYTCPVTDKWIGSRGAHSENLKQQGCRVLEAGETEAAAKYRERAEAEFDRKIEDTVEREIASYSSEKRERLHDELVNGGLDVVVERR